MVAAGGLKVVAELVCKRRVEIDRAALLPAQPFGDKIAADAEHPASPAVRLSAEQFQLKV